ncbi:hypothetical protein IW262DRAFT_1440636 [Armillaria fumosa]|nr:hypothetical protein IW262DRAFT_1440636 [Armillaria fumosa]
MSIPITIYDIPSIAPGSDWSPDVWKVRYVLNYKGLSYQTEWVEYPDIEPLYTKIGAKSHITKPDGMTPHYNAISQPCFTTPRFSDVAMTQCQRNQQQDCSPRFFQITCSCVGGLLSQENA